MTGISMYVMISRTKRKCRDKEEPGDL